MYARCHVSLLARRAANGGRRRLQPGLRGRRGPGALALAQPRPEPRPRAPPPRRLVITVSLAGPPPPARLGARPFPAPAPVSFYDHHDPSPRSLLFGLSGGKFVGGFFVITHVAGLVAGDSLVAATSSRRVMSLGGALAEDRVGCVALTMNRRSAVSPPQGGAPPTNSRTVTIFITGGGPRDVTSLSLSLTRRALI